MKQNLRWSRLALASLAAAAVIGCSSQVATTRTSQVDTSRSADLKFQKETEYYLASNALEGRGPGTQGQRWAAEYVAEQFRKAGLVPVPGHDFYQPFEWVLGTKVAPTSKLSLAGTELTLDDNYRPYSITANHKSVDAPVVFAGYGITSTRYKYDDYEGLDVKGKVVLIMRFDPRNSAGDSRLTNSATWSPEANLARKILTAQAKGAAGVLVVTPPGGKTEDSLQPFSGRGGRGIELPVVQIRQPALDAALKAKGLPSLADLTAPIDSTGKPAGKPLAGLTAAFNVDLARDTVIVRNVIGMLPGEGPHADEYVVIGSHYDHVGWGGPESLAPGVHAIHHGADDNASGTTAMMTLARRFGAAKQKPARTMLFMAFVNEEEGLIGSAYWTNHPTVPLDRIAYMLNLDMVGRMKNHVLIHGGEGTAPIFNEILTKAYDGEGLKNKSMGAGGFGPSDHESFARKHIPVLFLFTGLHPDYHRPTDTADKINYPGLIASTDVAYKIAQQLLVAPREKYDGSHDSEPIDLGEADAFPGLRPVAPPKPAREPIGLGLIPDMTTRDRGMGVDGVRDGMAAKKAGIKEGDTVLELDGTRVDSVQDLQEVYDRHKAGDTVKIKILRDGKTLELEVTFASRASNN
jgi:hypothetical protein